MGLNIIKRQHKPKVKNEFLGRMLGMMLPSSSKKLRLPQMNMGEMEIKPEELMDGITMEVLPPIVSGQITQI